VSDPDVTYEPIDSGAEYPEHPGVYLNEVEPE